MNAIAAEYPFVSWAMKSVADLVVRYRRKRAAFRELAALGPGEVAAIARDLKLSEASLRELATREKGTPLLLVRMLAALNKTMPPSADPLSRDMETVCGSCRNTRRCNRELASRTALKNYGKFCPNAYNLDFLPRAERTVAY